MSIIPSLILRWQYRFVALSVRIKEETCDASLSLAVVCFPWENSLDAEDGLSGEAPPSHPNRLFRFILVSFRSCFVSFLFRFANYHKPFRTGFPAREASENGTRIHYWTNDGHYIFRHAIQKSLTQFTGSGCQAKTNQSKVLVDGCGWEGLVLI